MRRRSLYVRAHALRGLFDGFVFPSGLAPMAPRPCTFCEIVAGRVSAHVVLDEPRAVAFLDVRPLFHGHVLLVPRAHVGTLPDLPDDDVGPFFRHAQRIARAIEATLGAEGTFVAINNKISQSVPHLHVHIVPRRAKDGLRGFFWPRHAYATEVEAAAIAARLRAHLGGTGDGGGHAKQNAP